MERFVEGVNNNRYNKNGLDIGLFIHKILLFMFFMTFTFIPTSYSAIRFGLLMSLFILSFALKRGKIKFDKNAGIILLIYVGYSILSAMLGIFNNGSIAGLKTNFLYPLLFFVMFLNILSIVSLNTISKILVACSFVVCLADLWVVLYGLRLIPISPNILYSIDLDYIFNGEIGLYYQYTSTHMVSHFFLAPFITVLVYINFKEKKNSFRLIILMVMEILCIYFSGRAALILSYSILFILIILYGNRERISTFFKEQFNSSHLIRNIILSIIFFIIVIVLINSKKINIEGIINYVFKKLQGISSSGGVIVDTRASQMREYLSGWLESPLIGHGMGTGVPYIRDGVWVDDKAIELTYVSTIYQSGLIGFLLLFFIILYTIKRIVRKIKNGLLNSKEGFPYILGLFGILIGAAADPYLFTMGCIWMLYLPFSIAATDEVEIAEIKFFGGLKNER